MKQAEQDQMREIAREFGRLETRVRRAGLKADSVKAAAARAEVADFARAILAGDYGKVA